MVAERRRVCYHGVRIRGGIMPFCQHRQRLPAAAALVVVSLLAPAVVRAVTSPSGVNWTGRHVLALESDDIDNGEFHQSADAATRYGLNVPWTGDQWTRVATAIRGHQDALGLQIPLTLYVVACYMEPDFTPVATGSTTVFTESFSGGAPAWSTFGAQPPIVTSDRYVSPAVSAKFSTSAPAMDGYARRWVNQCSEYQVGFWFRVDSLSARTNLVSVTGPIGRSMGIELQSAGSRLYLHEGYYDTDIMTLIGTYTPGTWRRITFREVGGRTQVDLDSDGVLEVDKPAQFLPTLTTAVILGDASTSIYSGTGYIDDLVFTRFDNTYPDSPRVTPIDVKWPDVVTAINANRDVFGVLSHGFTHGNNAEVQRRYAAGIVNDTSAPEENWWREEYDLVNNKSWGVLPQVDRFTRAFDILSHDFGNAMVVHVSPGNVYGTDTDVALAMCGAPYHETMTTGGGEASLDDPGIFWAVRTVERELFYHATDPDPLQSASLGARQVDSLFTIGYPAILQTHAFNALVQGGTGGALATYYSALLDTLHARHPELIALGTEEIAGLERDGWSVSLRRGNHIFARNYLPALHNFHVTVPDSLLVLGVKSLPLGQPVTWSQGTGEIIFSVPEGDYEIDVMSAALASVPGTAPVAAASSGAPVLRASPNPSTGLVRLSADLPASGRATLTILDTAGRRVRQLTVTRAASGPVEFDWDGTATNGGRAAPGIYLARLRWTGGAAQAKILLVP